MSCTKCRPVVVQVGGGEPAAEGANGVAEITFNGTSNAAFVAAAFPAGRFTGSPIVTGNRVFQAGDVAVGEGLAVWFGTTSATGTTVWAGSLDGGIVPAGTVHVHWKAEPAIP